MPTYTNLTILQGWLEIESIQAVTTVDPKPVAVVKGWIHTTDEAGLETFFDERHPVVISGRPAEVILDITRKLNDKCPRLSRIGLVQLPISQADGSLTLVNQSRPYVIAQGKLLSHEGRSCVDLKHISFLGLPWGALDALSEMETVMSRDVQALVVALTPLEKSQINRALGIALQALIARRWPG